MPVGDVIEKVKGAELSRRAGRVERVVGMAIESSGPRVSVGEECRLESAEGEFLSLAEVIGFEKDRVYSMPIDPVRGLRHGDLLVATGVQPRIPVGDALLGRVVDANGRPLDGKGPLCSPGAGDEPIPTHPIHAKPIPALERPRIDTPMATGLRCIDAMVTLGRGQRIGVFAGAGVGKSRLIGGVARHSSDECVVIALVGERNREVREFVEQELGESGRSRAAVFVATSDESPLRRVRCALAATTAAEEFRARGKSVTLVMDSLTRVAMALREVGLATGEPPSSKGYPPSVFAFLPRLLERAGNVAGGGSVTGIYTVLVEGDDLTDPVADSARAILDGHIVLSRSLAERGHFPAVDVLQSSSRVMENVVTREHTSAQREVRRLMAIHRDHQDLISIGAYKPGVDADVDRAVAKRAAIERFLQQDLAAPSSFDETVASLHGLVAPVDDAGHAGHAGAAATAEVPR